MIKKLWHWMTHNRYGDPVPFVDAALFVMIALPLGIMLWVGLVLGVIKLWNMIP